MVVSEIMTQGVKTVAPGTTLRTAARIMASEDCGALPVAHNEQLIGMLTDRDITVRALAQGWNPDECRVDEAMTREVLYMFADETTEDLVRIMSELQIRRLPVISRENRLVGIVSLGDLATRSDDVSAGAALRSVSEPVATEPLTPFEERV